MQMQKDMDLRTTCMAAHLGQANREPSPSAYSTHVLVWSPDPHFEDGCWYNETASLAS